MTKRILSMLLSLALLLSCISGITLFTSAAEPYAWLTVSQTDGSVSNGGLTGIGVQEAPLGGTTTPTAIGDTGKYGIKLGNTWGGFWFNANGKLTGSEDMALVIEYYIDSPAPSGSMMVVKVGNSADGSATGSGRNSFDFAEAGMLAQKVGTIVFPLSPAQKSMIHTNSPVYVTGGDASIYVLSFKIMALADAPQPEVPENTIPAAFGAFDFAGGNGATRSNGVVRYINNGGSETVENIPNGVAIADTGKYGYKVDADNNGLYWGGTILNNVPDGTAVTFVVEYYIDSDTELSGTVLQLTDNEHGLREFSHLKTNTPGVVYYSLTAEQVDAIQGNQWGGDMRLRVRVRGEGVGTLYIKSAMIVNTAALGLDENPGYAFYDLGSSDAVCPYYPDAAVLNWYNVNVIDAETHANHPGVPWLYRYVRLEGPAVSTDRTQNKPVYLKAYAAEGFENATASLGAYEYSNGETSGFSGDMGAPGYTFNFVDGVATLMIPAACLSNNLNGQTSLRFWYEEAVKVARLEIYDVETYCDEANADEATMADIHEAMRLADVNLVKDGYQAPTTEAPGATGTISCATCGAVVSENRVIPQLAAYAKIDFSTGTLMGIAANASGYDIQPIPGTDAYGALLDSQNENFKFNLTDALTITADDIANGMDLAITYEYYVTSNWANDHRIALVGNGYTLAVNGGGVTNVWDSLPVNVGQPLVREKLGIVSFTVGANSNIIPAYSGNIHGADPVTEGQTYSTLSQAEALVNGNQFEVLCWNNDNGTGNRKVYIKSITIHDASELNKAGDSSLGYYYADFEGVALDPYYPEYKVQDNYGITASASTAEYYPEDTNQEYVRFNYMYLVLTPDMLCNEADMIATPAKLVIERKEGSDVNGMTFQYQIGGPGPVWSSNIDIVFDENGIFEMDLLDAKFFNSLNGGSSIRMREIVWEYNAETGEYTEKIGDEYSGIASIKLYDLRECCEEYHDQFTEYNGNVKYEGRVDATYDAPGYTGDLVCAHCGEVFEAGKEIPILVDTDYAKMDFSDGSVTLTAVENLAVMDGGTSLKPVQIPGTDAYGLVFGSHNSGVKFSLGDFGGFDAASIANGQQLAISVEYYLPTNVDGGLRIMFDPQAGSTKYLALYGSYSGTTWDATAVNPSNALTRGALNVATFVVGADVNYEATKGQFGGNDKFEEPRIVNTNEFATALVSGGEIILRSWGVSEAAPFYIKSITIYDVKDLAVRETEESDIDYIDFTTSFAESPIHYPQYTLVGNSNGLIAADVNEGPDDNGIDVIYTYFSVSNALIKEGQEFCPVVVRFTFKDDAEIDAFNWSYQGLHYDGTNGGSVWSHLTTEVTGKVVEVTLPDAVFENNLNGKGSIRVSNDPARGLVTDSLEKIEVLAIADKTALGEAIEAAKNVTAYKTPASVEAYNAVLEAAKAVYDDSWASANQIDKALADLIAAEALLVDCDHTNGTKIVGYVAETCTADGYTGDTACADCGFVAEGDEGQVIPKHETKIINVKEDSCKEPGYSGDLWCEQCQIIVSEGIYGTALPHTWNEGEVTKPATPNDRGEITKTCTVCGETMKTYFDYEFTAEFGDVNEDGNIDSTDARLVLQYAVGKIDETAITIELADVNGDGKADSTDARLILQYAVGKIQSFA